MIALKKLAPERYDDLRRHVASGRAELGSALFLNPTVSLSGGEALMRLGIEGGRRTRPGLSVGVCGEHGGDPASIAVFLGLGVDYVSCSPFRVPIARLAAARAVLDEADSAG